MTAFHLMLCPETAPAPIVDGQPDVHEHRCIHPAQIPADVDGIPEHQCECGATWTVTTRCLCQQCDVGTGREPYATIRGRAHPRCPQHGHEVKEARS
jgi:hypothetical protein